jgi:hypothetical protein
MDYSQYIRLKNEAANVYVARTKVVDASFLTLQRQQKAAAAGYTNIQSIPYYNGANVLNPILYDLSSCPIKHQYTQGYTTTNRLSQQQDHATRAAGKVLCRSVDYSTASPGIQRLNCSEVSTILTQYNSLAPVPGVWKPYGYGINNFLPLAKDNNSDCANCNTDKTVFPSG